MTPEGDRVNTRSDLTRHFSLEEFTFSETAARRTIDNTLPPELLPAALYTLTCMEVVRVILDNRAIKVTSGYRGFALDEAIKGYKPKKVSQHSRAEAVDFVCPGYGTPWQVCHRLVRAGLHFDQLIYEGTWVHISFTRVEPRRQVLTARFAAGGVEYVKGLVDPDSMPA